MEKAIENLKMESDTTKFSVQKIQERVAVIEERQKSAERDRDEMKANDKEQLQMLRDLGVQIAGYRDEHNLLKGKFAGFWLAVSGVGFLIMTFWDWISRTLGALFK